MLNQTSSVTIAEKSETPAIKGRRYVYKQTSQDDYQKMNKIPYKEAVQKIKIFQ